MEIKASNMGNSCDACETVRNSDHIQENNRVNDGFFPLLGLFTLDNRRHHVSLLHPPHYTYTPPSPQFLNRESTFPPRILLEIRKGLHFPTHSSTPLSVQITFSASNAEYLSPACSPVKPRWYFLVLHTYQDQHSESQAVVRVMRGEKLVAATSLDLSLVANRYEVFWSSLALETENPAEKLPKIEFRVLNLVDPKAFWSLESDGFKAAVKAIASTTRFS